MNSRQFNKIQREIFDVQVERNRKMSIARQMALKSASAVMRRSAEYDEANKKELHFDEHSIVMSISDLPESTREVLVEDNKSLTLVTGNNWKTLSFPDHVNGVPTFVISSRGTSKSDTDKKLSITKQLGYFDPLDSDCRSFLIDTVVDLFSIVGGCEAKDHTISLNGMELKMLSSPTSEQHGIGYHLQIKTPTVVLELRHIIAIEQNEEDQLFFMAVKMTTHSGTNIFYFDEDSNSATIDQLVMQSSLQGYNCNPLEVNLWK